MAGKAMNALRSLDKVVAVASSQKEYPHCLPVANYVQNINVFVGDGFGTSPRQRFGIGTGIACELGAEVSGGYEIGVASDQS